VSQSVELYVAMPKMMLDAIFGEPLGQLLIQNQRLRVILFDPIQEVIVQWIPG
jgi:hypothetical protein